jgi:hypothetical protein
MQVAFFCEMTRKNIAPKLIFAEICPSKIKQDS